MLSLERSPIYRSTLCFSGEADVPQRSGWAPSPPPPRQLRPRRLLRLAREAPSHRPEVSKAVDRPLAGIYIMHRPCNMIRGLATSYLPGGGSGGRRRAEGGMYMSYITLPKPRSSRGVSVQRSPRNVHLIMMQITRRWPGPLDGSPGDARPD